MQVLHHKRLPTFENYKLKRCLIDCVCVCVSALQVSYEGDRAAVRNRRHFKAHGGHVVSIQVSARRVLSGSRDKTALVQDFWAKMLDVGSCRRNRREAAARAAAAEEEKGSRFLARRRRRAL